MEIVRPRSSRSIAVVLVSTMSLWGLAGPSPAAPPTGAPAGGARRPIAPPPETLDQPPASAQVLSSRTEGPKGLYLRGPSASVQVNVNASGNNIVGDAANESTIAIDPVNPNRIAIAWRQFDSVTSNFRQAGYAFSTDGGQTWTFPGVLEPGQFRSDPVLGSDAAGILYYSSLSSVTTAEVFKSLDGGATWLGPVSAFGGDKQWISVDDRPSGTGAGHIYQNWNVQFSCCPPGDFTRSINGGASFQAPIAIPLPSMKWGTSDVGTDGTLYLAGSTLNQNGHLVARSSNASNPTVTPTFDFVSSVNLGGFTGGFGAADDPNPGGLLGQVWIAADPSDVNRVYMLASVTPPSGNPVDVMFTRSVNKGVSWSAPVRVNDDPASGAYHWFGTMSVAPNGRIDVIWNDTRHSGVGNLSELFYSFSMDMGVTWSPNVPLSPMWDSHIGWPQQNKIGDYYHSVSDNAGVSIAYAATFNGEQDVYFLRVPANCGAGAVTAQRSLADVAADCNSNGVDDICDVFSGFSVDCNRNLIPDSCENPPDCNGNGESDFCDIAAGAPDCNINGVPDSCDISGGSSPDANGNQIPDECEGACCPCVGSCSLTTPTVCAAQSGSFFGTGTTCDGVVCGAPNNACADRTVLPSSLDVSIGFSTDCATTDGPSSIACDVSTIPIGADIWYQYVAPCSGTVRASLCGTTTYDSVLAAYGSGLTCTCTDILGAPLACGDDTCGVGGGPSVVTFGATTGDCFLLRVGGWNNEIGSGVLHVSYDVVTECPCQTATPPTPDQILNASGVAVQSAKNRFLSFAGGDPGWSQAVRVKFVSLPGAFSVFNGTVAWVDTPGAASELPGRAFSDPVGSDPTFMTARLVDAPVYAPWSTFGVVHVYDERIVPSRKQPDQPLEPAVYEVQFVSNGCDVNAEANFSTALSVTNARWGDVAGLTSGQFRAPDGVVDVTSDVLGVLAKFGAAPGAPIKARAEMVGSGVTGPQAALTGKIEINDVLAVLGAFAGGSYPFAPPP